MRRRRALRLLLLVPAVAFLIWAGWSLVHPWLEERGWFRESPAPVLAADRLGERLIDRLLLQETAGNLSLFRHPLHSALKHSGKLPRTLREMENFPQKWFPDTPDLADFYRIAGDVMPDHGYRYGPDLPDWVLVAAPRSGDRGLPVLGLEFHRGQPFKSSIWAGELTGDGFRNTLGVVSTPVLDRRLRLPDPEDDGLGLGGLRLVRLVQRAQQSHAYLQAGRFADHLEDLTLPRPPARLPLLPERTLRVKEKHSRYRLTFGSDATGWWAEANPQPEAAKHLRYRFRVGKHQPLSYASSPEGPWLPVDALP